MVLQIIFVYDASLFIILTINSILINERRVFFYVQDQYMSDVGSSEYGSLICARRDQDSLWKFMYSIDGEHSSKIEQKLRGLASSGHVPSAC